MEITMKLNLVVRAGFLLASVFCAGLAPAHAQTVDLDKPQASTSMFESTREPASDAESAAVLAELESIVTGAPAVFVHGYMVDRTGRSLYVFDQDRPNVSTCYRACERLWPPLMADLDDEPFEEFTITERADGARQWAWRGKPLYFWPSDKRPGDRTGDNVNGVWHLVLDPQQAATAAPIAAPKPPPAPVAPPRGEYD
jgi:predicted lipoprotein with Yx(FWY)xxD motif